MRWLRPDYQHPRAGLRVVIDLRREGRALSITNLELACSGNSPQRANPGRSHAPEGAMRVLRFSPTPVGARACVEAANKRGRDRS